MTRPASTVPETPLSEKTIRYVAAHLLLRLDAPDKAEQFLMQRGAKTREETEELLDPLGRSCLTEEDLFLSHALNNAEQLYLRAYLKYWEGSEAYREAFPLSEGTERYVNKAISPSLPSEKEESTLPSVQLIGGLFSPYDPM